MPTWCPPQPCLPQSAERPLTAEQVAHWRTHGWLVLSELWPRDLLADAVACAEGLFPTPEGYAAGESNHGTSNFPFDHELSDPLNQLTVHPRFVALSTQLLGTDEVRLTQASVSCRYDDDGEQGHHQDYGNNYLVCPPSDRIETVNAILYYGDVRESGSPTCFVPNAPFELSGSGGGLEAEGRNYSRDDRPEFYEEEMAPDFRAGTALIYHQAVFHRLSGATNPGTRRLASHFVYRREDAPWVQWVVPTYNGATSNSAAAREFFRGLSAESRSVLGFPRVGSPYWNEETMRAVSQRYHGMDMTPYREGVASARL